MICRQGAVVQTLPALSVGALSIIPFTMSGPSGLTAYFSSGAIREPYVVRGVIVSTGTDGGSGFVDLGIRIRVCQQSAANAANFAGGQPLLNALGVEPTIYAAGYAQIGPMWLPVTNTPHSLIVEVVPESLGGNCTVTVLVTPQAEIDRAQA